MLAMLFKLQELRRALNPTWICFAKNEGAPSGRGEALFAPKPQLSEQPVADPITPHSPR